MIGESGTWHCLYLCHATASASSCAMLLLVLVLVFCPMLLLELVLFLCDATATASQAHGIATATTCASRTHYDASVSATTYQAQVLNVIDGTSACDAFSSLELIRISGKCDAKRCQQ